MKSGKGQVHDLIEVDTSGKGATTMEALKNPVVKPFIKPE